MWICPKCAKLLKKRRPACPRCGPGGPALRELPPPSAPDPDEPVFRVNGREIRVGGETLRARFGRPVSKPAPLLNLPPSFWTFFALAWFPLMGLVWLAMVCGSGSGAGGSLAMLLTLTAFV